MTQTGASAPGKTGRVAAALFAAAALALLFAFGLHLAAVTASRRAEDQTDLASRASAAQFAATVEPWNAEFDRRARVLRLWEQGAQELDAGDYNSAVDTLRAAYRGDVGNAALLALFKRAQEVQTLATNRKAHLQHGHEGPGGTLRPQDIER